MLLAYLTAMAVSGQQLIGAVALFVMGALLGKGGDDDS